MPLASEDTTQETAREAVGGLGVVVVAAGRSTRMGGIDKTFALVLGSPLIAHTLDRFVAFAPVSEIALVLAADSLEQGRELLLARDYQKPVHLCVGGERRQDSVRNGLERLSPCGWIMVHDGARPCLDRGILERGLAAAADCGAAVAGMPVKDTIKMVSHDRLVEETPDRSRLWAAQTPQVFRILVADESPPSLPTYRHRRRLHGGNAGPPGADVRRFLREHEGHHGRGPRAGRSVPP